MGARMVISGVGNGRFNPDHNITRAEFAAIMVRGLGLELQEGGSGFSDVYTGDWYQTYIQTAHAYGLISGYADGTFRPSEQITREQAMVVLAKMMKVTGLANTLPDRQADQLLAQFTDNDTIAPWAKDSAADSLQAQIVSGRSEALLAPKAYITRAEVAMIIQRLLERSGLI